MDSFITKIDTMSNQEFLNYLFSNNLIKKEPICGYCHSIQEFKVSNDSNDGFSLRCMNYNCLGYENRNSIRTSGFFQDFKISIRTILKVLFYWSQKISQTTILRLTGINSRTYKRIINKLVDFIDNDMVYNSRKMGGPGKITQTDETMLNYAIKNHRGRSPHNLTYALVIIEYSDEIDWVYACVIANKKAETVIPIICDKVYSGSIIHTDEAKLYTSLSKSGFVHKSVCHKYHFMDPITGIHTQAVESMNNNIKYEIKLQKGVRVEDRPNFLKLFCWKYNNRKMLFENTLALIKAS